MPPLIAFAGLLGGAAALRWAIRAARKVNRELEEIRSRGLEMTQPTDRPTLRRDPASGAYRPE